MKTLKKQDVAKAVVEIKKETFSILTSTIESFKKEADEDTTQFAEMTKQNTDRWEHLLHTKKLTLKEHSFLEASQNEISEMESLKQEGLTSIQVGAFKDQLLQASLGKILSVIK